MHTTSNRRIVELAKPLVFRSLGERADWLSQVHLLWRGTSPAIQVLADQVHLPHLSLETTNDQLTSAIQVTGDQVLLEHPTVLRPVGWDIGGVPGLPKPPRAGNGIQLLGTLSSSITTPVVSGYQVGLRMSWGGKPSGRTTSDGTPFSSRGMVNGLRVSDGRFYLNDLGVLADPATEEGSPLFDRQGEPMTHPDGSPALTNPFENEGCREIVFDSVTVEGYTLGGVLLRGNRLRGSFSGHIEGGPPNLTVGHEHPTKSDVFVFNQAIIGQPLCSNDSSGITFDNCTMLEPNVERVWGPKVDAEGKLLRSYSPTVRRPTAPGFPPLRTE